MSSISPRGIRWGAVCAATMAALVCLPRAFAWELQELELEKRVKKTPLIVVGTIERTVKETQSKIEGVGLCWEASLRVERVLKGEAEPFILVEWCEAAQAESVTSPFNGDHIWFLKAGPDHSVHLLAGNFPAILFRDRLESVEALLPARTD